MEFCQNIILHKEDFTKNELVIASILGDGYIGKDGVIEIYHSMKQKKYTLWLMDLYSKYFKVRYRERICKDKKTGKEFKQCGFRVLSTKYTKLMRRIMYHPQKRVTLKLLNKLTPLGLAIWYMDDGNLSFIKDKSGNLHGRQIRLSTHSFTYEEHLLIVKYFKENWDIECRIHNEKGKHIIWMNGTEGKKFINIIKDYISIDMYYKMCYRYYGKYSEENLCKMKCCKGNCPYNIV